MPMSRRPNGANDGRRCERRRQLRRRAIGQDLVGAGATIATRQRQTATDRHTGYGMSWLRRVARAIIVLVILAFALESQAEQRWPAASDSLRPRPDWAYSRDMTSLELSIAAQIGADGTSQPARVHIPRAYVVLIPGYEHVAMPYPTQVDTVTVAIAMTHPSGRPLSVAAAERAESDMTELSQALDALRTQTGIVVLTGVAAGYPWERSIVGPGPFVAGRREYDGLMRDYTSAMERGGRNRGFVSYRGEPGVDEFVVIWCGFGESPSPDRTCRVAFRVGRTLAAMLTTPEIRFPGGRAFANERARAARATICRFAVSGCEPPLPDDGRRIRRGAVP
jgi:hypothetical protein